MGWRCALLLGVLGLIPGAPISAAEPHAPRTLSTECAQRIDPGLRGLDALRAACPALESDLEALGLTALLPEDWKTHISPHALTDLSALTDRYTQRTERELPDPASLQRIARQLEAPAGVPSWWERLKSWLASWLDSDRNRWPAWLRSLRLSRGAALALVFGSVALVVIAAAVVVARELRAAGAFGLRRAQRAQSAGIQPTAVTERSLTSMDIDAAPEHLRPVILLRLLVAALARSNRLEREGVLTCRELIAAARFDTPAQREIFANVALSAEQVLYGELRRKADPSGDVMLGNARGLYAQLTAAAAGQPAR